MEERLTLALTRIREIENEEGHTRRTQAKSIVLGILYGRGINSIAEQLKVTPQEAQIIYNKVIDAFLD